MKRVLFLFFVLAGILGMGCAPVPPKGDAGDSGVTDTGADAYVDLTGTYACGAITCNPNEYCIHPCCQTQCAGSNGGLCPFGTHNDATCPDGCRNDSCMVPPNRCGGNTDPCFGVARIGRDAYCYCG